MAHDQDVFEDELMREIQGDLEMEERFRSAGLVPSGTQAVRTQELPQLLLLKGRTMRSLLVLHGLRSQGVDVWAWMLIWKTEDDPTAYAARWIEGGWKEPHVVAELVGQGLDVEKALVQLRERGFSNPGDEG